MFSDSSLSQFPENASSTCISRPLSILGKYIIPIKLDQCGKFVIYGHSELVLFLIGIVTVHHLSLRNGNGTSSFLHSREGETQGDPLAMVACGICIFQLIQNMKAEFTDVSQTWYAGNLGALDTFARFQSYFN